MLAAGSCRGWKAVGREGAVEAGLITPHTDAPPSPRIRSSCLDVPRDQRTIYISIYIYMYLCNIWLRIRVRACENEREIARAYARTHSSTACPGHVDDVGASSCGRTIIQRARGGWTAEATGVVGWERSVDVGWWMLDGGCRWWDGGAREVVDFTRSIAEPAAPPPYARAQARSKNSTGTAFHRRRRDPSRSFLNAVEKLRGTEMWIDELNVDGFSLIRRMKKVCVPDGLAYT